MSIIATIFIGLIVGLIARFVKPGDDKLGWIMTIVLGIAGALLAGFAGRAMGWYQPGETAGFIASVVGAVVLLAIYAVATRRG
ncbi:MAG: GlsB/YeaQ/YmgE family stress response membrane protein [Pseudomonadota bacterium]